jgi:hypothetical protein
MKIILKSLFFGMVTESIAWWGLDYLITGSGMYGPIDLLNFLFSMLHKPAIYFSGFISFGPPYGLLLPLIAEALIWSLCWGFIFFLLSQTNRARGMKVS